jgi:hypothetical protein
VPPPASGPPGAKAKRAVAAIMPDTAAEAPIISASSAGSATYCAAAPATAPSAHSRRNRLVRKRRAMALPKPAIQNRLTARCSASACRRA